MGLFDKHKGMQSLPGSQQALANLLAIYASKLHLCLFILFLVWFVVYITLICLDRHNLWVGIANIIVLSLFIPFQTITPKRQLAAVFLKLKIRPSHCGFCEYDLRATEGDTCPECGTRLVPKDRTET